MESVLWFSYLLFSTAAVVFFGYLCHCDYFVLLLEAIRDLKPWLTGAASWRMRRT